MPAKLIDGKALALKIRSQIAREITSLKEKYNQVPGLATVLVGQNPASQVYVNNKIKACQETGIAIFDHSLPEKTSQAELLGLLGKLSEDPRVHGVLVQLPLPQQISLERLFDALAPHKDVDGFSLINWGRFFKAKTFSELNQIFIPCTPLGVLEILDSVGFVPAGKLSVVIGRSNIVGRPMAHLLTLKNATVIQCHSQTQNIEELTQKADLIVVAIARPLFLKSRHIKKGACVIDVGINRLDDGKLVGDCDTKDLLEKASFITPVPGGVGPMTIAMLLGNTLKAFKEWVRGQGQGVKSGLGPL